MTTTSGPLYFRERSCRLRRKDLIKVMQKDCNIYSQFKIKAILCLFLLWRRELECLQQDKLGGGADARLGTCGEEAQQEEAKVPSSRVHAAPQCVLGRVFQLSLIQGEHLCSVWPANHGQFKES